MGYADNRPSWDIFCRVIDNFGDVGVCWRLARQLAAEHGLAVRLWVDDLAAFRRLCPAIDAGRAVQSWQGVNIRLWPEPFPEVEPAGVVIEAFACELPERYVRAMAARVARPRWINLEYLSAEAWVGECHGLASPSPRWPLTKHFFFPGFAEETGGLLLERDLLARRRAFRADSAAQAAFWQTLGLLPPEEDEIRLSLFCYPASPTAELFTCWGDGAQSLTCLVPEGVAGAAIADFFGVEAVAAGAALRRGNLLVRIIPFLDQEAYDRLLWSCDGNVVRGEDSFVRGLWAARPMLWQPYPQAEIAHLHKLEAFLDRYCVGLDAPAAAALAAMWRAWSHGEGVALAWPAFRAHWTTIEKHAETWAGDHAAQGDLASKLVLFCSDRL
jgi:uncharacterized repeat protein (TIGR03837 family)